MCDGIGDMNQRKRFLYWSVHFFDAEKAGQCNRSGHQAWYRDCCSTNSLKIRAGTVLVSFVSRISALLASFSVAMVMKHHRFEDSVPLRTRPSAAPSDRLLCLPRMHRLAESHRQMISVLRRWHHLQRAFEIRTS